MHWAVRVVERGGRRLYISANALLDGASGPVACNAWDRHGNEEVVHLDAEEHRTLPLVVVVVEEVEPPLELDSGRPF